MAPASAELSWEPHGSWVAMVAACVLCGRVIQGEPDFLMTTHPCPMRVTCTLKTALIHWQGWNPHDLMTASQILAQRLHYLKSQPQWPSLLYVSFFWGDGGVGHSKYPNQGPHIHAVSSVALQGEQLHQDGSVTAPHSSSSVLLTVCGTE
jgi:hypothetical protein